MGDAGKHLPSGSIAPDLKSLFPAISTRRTKLFAYGFVVAFVACTAFLAFSPSGNASPWFNTLFTSSSSSSSVSTSIAPYRSQFSSIVSFFFPKSSSQSPSPETSIPSPKPRNQTEMGVGSRGTGVGSPKDGVLGGQNRTNVGTGSPGNGVSGKNQTEKETGSRGNAVSEKNRAGEGVGSKQDGVLVGKNQTGSAIGLQGNGVSEKNQTAKAAGSGENGVPPKNRTNGGNGSDKVAALVGKNQTGSGVPVGSRETGALAATNQTGKGADSKVSGAPTNNKKNPKTSSEENGVLAKNHTADGVAVGIKKTETPTAIKKSETPATAEHKGVAGGDRPSNLTASLMKENGSAAPALNNGGQKREEWIDNLIGCDIFHGNWVRDDSYPLYPEGSCPHIDEPFDCYHNGRPDRAYQKLRWQPTGCSIPRLNATDMLERLRGKRLVFVGDSLNRNMWESLVCALRNSVKDKHKVLEASGRHEFRTEGSYSFLFKDYGCTVEFFRSPFLVQEWEMPSGNGTKRETLRLDIVERSASRYKDAYVIIFNTGHWWTHEKTAKGRDYYQEGNRVYSELNVAEAFHKALNTWAKWVDASVNPKETLVFFRGYSASHFSGGRWNSGGQCDKETEPIKNEAYLSSYPPKMSILESVIKGMKTPVSYLNITRMTDYRKDAHPSIYRKPNMTEDERSPDKIQDCSHWCLPGVPDTWNELLYAQLLIKQHQMQH